MFIPFVSDDLSAGNDAIRPRHQDQKVETNQIQAHLQRSPLYSHSTPILSHKLTCLSLTGTELVAWLVKHLKLTPEDAVAFGKEMMRRSMFHHITFTEPFQDKPHLYRFYQVPTHYTTRYTLHYSLHATNLN